MNSNTIQRIKGPNWEFHDMHMQELREQQKREQERRMQRLAARLQQERWQRLELEASQQLTAGLTSRN